MSSLQKYRKIKYLGKGSYGSAILVELRSKPSQKFVIKEIIIGHMPPNEQQAAKNEADVLNQLSHSNITMYIESFVENSKLYIVMEHADGGDLSNAIKIQKQKNTRWSEEEVMRIFVQICLALKHVHDTNILHRDLKSQNVFLTSKGIVKLGDFGIAKVLNSTDDQARTQIGTPYYLSPEICENHPYGRASDIWSLGVVLFEIAALEMPFQANSLAALVLKICNAEPDYKRLIEPFYSANFLAMSKKLLNKNPLQRPILDDLVHTEFVQVHISKLLSFTIKSGTGGVASSGSENGNAQVNELPELKINESQSSREQSKEKLRQFRQDMNAGHPRSHSNPPPNMNNNDVPIYSVRGGKSLAEYQQQQQQQQQQQAAFQLPPSRYEMRNNMNNYNNLVQYNNSNISTNNAGPTSNSNRNGPTSYRLSSQEQLTKYEVQAREEFFNNRAAARAVKAKIEALERGGNPSTTTTASAATNANVASTNENSMWIPSSESDREKEDRIALIKAKKEREKAQELAEKQRQLTEACQEIRDQRRDRQANLRPAIAFDIDFSGGGDVINSKKTSNDGNRRVNNGVNASPLPSASSASSVRSNLTNVGNGKNGVSSSGSSNKSPGAPLVSTPSLEKIPEVLDGPRGVSSVASNERMRDNSVNDTSHGNGNGNGGRARRGWNIPAEKAFHIGEVGMIRLESAKKDSPSFVECNEEIVENIIEEEKEDHHTPQNPIASDEATVLSRLNQRDQANRDRRDQARMIFRKLRDQNQSQHQAQRHVQAKASPAAEKKKISVLQLDNVVAQVNEMKGYIDQLAGKGDYRESKDSQFEAKDVRIPSQGVMENKRAEFKGSNEDASAPDDELGETIDRWLELQKRAVTHRKTKSNDRESAGNRQSDLEVEDKEVEEDPNAVFYRSGGPIGSDSRDKNGGGHGTPQRRVLMSQEELNNEQAPQEVDEDPELLNLQCALASALIN